MAVLLALGAALSNALGSIFQRLGLEAAGVGDGGNLGGIVRRPIWVAGILAMAAAFALQASALHLGAVGVVQPLLLAELPFVVLVLVCWFGQRHARHDVVAVLGAAVGLAGILGALQPTDGDGRPSALRWVVVVGVGVGLELGAVALGRHRHPATKALVLGGGAAVGFALVAVLTKVAAGVAAAAPSRLVLTWQVWVLCAVGAGSLTLMQLAFSAGPFSMSQGALILVNPVASVLFGTATFGCHVVATPPRLSVAAVSAVVLVGSILVVLRSPLVAETGDVGGVRLSGSGLLARRRSARTR